LEPACPFTLLLEGLVCPAVVADRSASPALLDCPLLDGTVCPLFTAEPYVLSQPFLLACPFVLLSQFLYCPFVCAAPVADGLLRSALFCIVLLGEVLF
jgi:hypothetical protein